MIKTKTGLNIYRFNFNKEKFSNYFLKRKLMTCLKFIGLLPNSIFNELKTEDKKCERKLKRILKLKQNNLIFYFTEKNGFLINFFVHHIDKNYPDCVALDFVYANPAFRKLGYNTLCYQYIIDETFKSKYVKYIAAQVASEGGKDMLTRLDFMHDTCDPDFEKFFVALFNPKAKNYEELTRNYVKIPEALKRYPQSFAPSLEFDLEHFE